MNNELAQKLVKGMLIGFASAVLVDLDAWHKGLKFDWDVAAKRWLIGMVTGLFGAAGLSGEVSAE
jgi:hypothetical protein